MFKFKINDQVKITAGKDKGQTGLIAKVFPLKNQVLVEGKNLYKKHVKKQGEQPGRIVELARPLSVANISLICPNCQKVTRVGFSVSGTTKTRICRKCQKPIVVNVVKKEAKAKK